MLPNIQSVCEALVAKHVEAKYAIFLKRYEKKNRLKPPHCEVSLSSARARSVVRWVTFDTNSSIAKSLVAFASKGGSATLLITNCNRTNLQPVSTCTHDQSNTNK